MKVYNKIINKLNKFITLKNILLVIIIITILLMIPILRVSFYTHPSADDYSYGINTANVIKNEGIMEVFKGTIKTLNEFYSTWQGTYSAIILFSLNPSVFGNNMYFLTTFIIIGLLFIAMYYFLKQIINKFLKCDKKIFWICLLALFLLFIETMPDKCQGLFWWNGASFYMIFLALEFLEWGLLVKRYFLGEKTKLNYVLLSILIAIIGGGNYVTALQQIIILALINIYTLKNKDKSAICLFLIAGLSLGISAMAPGNATRQAMLPKMNPVKAIILSFAWGLYKAYIWMTPLNFEVLLLVTLMLFQTYKNAKIKFNHPIIVALFAFCIFSAEFTPTLYAQSSIGEGRMHNIMYISYLIFSLITLYYIIGSIRNKLISTGIFSKDADKLAMDLIKNNLVLIVIVISGTMILSIFINRAEMTSYSTNQILKNGMAQKYDEECKERIKILENKDIKEVEFKELTVHPYHIFNNEFDPWIESWKNLPAAKIYNKDYIVLVKE